MTWMLRILLKGGYASVRKFPSWVLPWAWLGWIVTCTFTLSYYINYHSIVTWGLKHMFLEQLKLKPKPLIVLSLYLSHFLKMEYFQQTYLQKVFTWSYLNHNNKIYSFRGFGLLGEWLIHFIP